MTNSSNEFCRSRTEPGATPGLQQKADGTAACSGPAHREIPVSADTWSTPVLALATANNREPTRNRHEDRWMPVIAQNVHQHSQRKSRAAEGRRSAVGAASGIALSLLLAAALPTLVAAADPGPVAGATAGSEAISPGTERNAHHMEQGARHFRAGDFVNARLAWQNAFAGYTADDDAKGQALALARSGEASLAIGQVPRGIESLSRALEIAEAADDPRLQSAIGASLGNGYATAGRFDRAEALLRWSVESAERIGDEKTVASASNNLGNLFATQGRFDEAEQAFRRALDGARTTGDQELAIRASANLARTLVETGRQEEAAQLLFVSLDQIDQLSATHQKAYSLISIGRLFTRIASTDGHAKSEWVEAAYQALSKASRISEKLGDQAGESYALGYLGNLYEWVGRYDEALQLTQQAIVVAQRADTKEALYRWYWQAGHILVAKDDRESAIFSYQQAVDTLESIRQDVNAGIRARKTTFRETAGPVYFELADLLLRRSANQRNEDRATQDLVDARQTVELLKGAELEDYFQDDCVAALQAKTAGIDRLESRTAAIYPIILDDRTEMLLSLPDGIERISVAVGKTALTAEIRAFRSKLEKRTTHEYYVHARQLYDWLFLPIEPALQKHGIETLVIVPDGAMRTIPLAALHDGERFLGARYALATTPGLTLTDPRPIERKNVELLANGLSVSVQGFPSLPSVDDEIASIERLYGGTILKNKEFVVANMERALSKNPFSIVHIASHAQFDSNLDSTFLLTYDGKLSMNALEQFIGSTKFRDDPVELLTLSACQTAAGDDRAALGLAGIAVKAGARSAVATLWTVNDPASAALVTEFYEQLKDPGISKARALQRAQLQLAEDLRYWHPSYWSPFLLIGNWL